MNPKIFFAKVPKKFCEAIKVVNVQKGMAQPCKYKPSKQESDVRDSVMLAAYDHLAVTSQNGLQIWGWKNLL